MALAEHRFITPDGAEGRLNQVPVQAHSTPEPDIPPVPEREPLPPEVPQVEPDPAEVPAIDPVPVHDPVPHQVPLHV